MDGVRAYWDKEKLISRNGKEFNVPKAFTCLLPKKALDGELWMGRQSLEKLSGLLNSIDHNQQDWSQVQYVIFDLPESQSPYKERLKELQQCQLPPHAIVANNIECNGLEHLKNLLDSVLEEGERDWWQESPLFCTYQEEHKVC